jgi:hypothetical protein
MEASTVRAEDGDRDDIREGLDMGAKYAGTVGLISVGRLENVAVV